MPRGRNDQCSVNTTYDLHRTIEGNWFRFLVSRPKCAGLSAVYLKISTVGEAVGLGQYLFSNSIEWKSPPVVTPLFHTLIISMFVIFMWRRVMNQRVVSLCSKE